MFAQTSSCSVCLLLLRALCNVAVQVEAAQQNKVVYIMGRVEMTSGKDLNVFKQVFLEYLYNPLERNCRTLTDSWNIPRSRLIEVGMSYEL